MYPVLYKLGFFTFYTYGFFVGLGIILSYLYLSRQLIKRSNLSEKELNNLGLLVLLGGFLGARLFYLVLNLGEFSGSWIDIFRIWRGGLVFYGGLLGGVLALYYFVRRNKFCFAKFADYFAPALALAQGVGRLGCFFAGCCYGKETNVGWGVVFRNPDSLAPLGIRLHPVQLYSAFGNLLIFAFLSRQLNRSPVAGKITAWYFVLAGAFRFLLEFFRGDERGFIFAGFTFLQWLSLLIFLTGVGMLCYFRSRKNSYSECQ